MAMELVIIEGPQPGRRLAVGSVPTTFGRGPAATHVFPQDTFMSSLHMTVEDGPQGVVLTDHGSTNGSFINGRPFSQVLATSGDIVTIGTLTMQLIDTRPADVASPAPIPKQASQTRSSPASAPESKYQAVIELLSRAEGKLFCLLDAAADEMIPALLEVAREQSQSLYEGDSATELARWAPFLIRLSPGSPLLRVLIDKGWGKGWASFFTAEVSFDDVRKHFRKFLMVQIENGKEVYFRFYDPRVLRDFLPTADTYELTTFFGPVALWIVEAPNPEEVLILWTAPAGLEHQRIPMANLKSRTSPLG